MNGRSSVLLVLLAGCRAQDAVQPPQPPAVRPARAPADWLAAVQSRVQNGRHTFRSEGPGVWSAAVPERQLRGTFDADGAALSSPESTLFVRLDSVGGEPLPARTPALGAGDGRPLPAGGEVRRLEAADGSWWSSTSAGFEQGFDIARPGAGDEVEALVAIEGGRVAQRGDDLAIVANGQTWLVSDLRVTDASGRSLPSRMSPTAGGYRIRVDAAGAAFPLSVDPTYSTASWSYEGTPAFGPLGEGISGGGDVNGDGYGDMLLGIPDTGPGGACFIYLGSADGLPEVPSQELVGEAAEGSFGGDCNTAGDVNGDGYDDVVVGASTMGVTAGAAFVFHGSPYGVDTIATTELLGSVLTNSYFGAKAVGIGDVNGDGYGDLAVSAPGYFHETGLVYVYLGSATGVASTATPTLRGDNAHAYFGEDVAGAGDVNGDGYDDVVVGERGYLGGRALVYLGSASGLASTASTTLTTSSYSALGTAVEPVGDVNGDGYADIAVGAPFESFSTGSVSVYLGSSTGLSSVATQSLVGENRYDEFGATLLGGFDVNGDGAPDLLVGATAYSGGSGSLYLFEGDGSAFDSTIAQQWYGENSLDLYSASLGAADMDGDGYDDLVIGAMNYSEGGLSLGRVYYYPGSATGPAASASLTLTGSSSVHDVGTTVTRAGDLNGDGFDDLLIPSLADEYSVSSAYVFFGSPAGPSVTADITLTGASVGDAFAGAAAGLGDVNADGYDDIAISASATSSNTGRVYVYLGSASGPSTTADTTLSGPSSDSYFGEGLASAGDVNGDGYADMLVSAPGYNSATGQAYLYHGSPTGFGSSADTTFDGLSSSDNFGYGLGSLGDCNGDGYDDIGIGAPFRSSDQGAVYFYHGSAAGVSSTYVSTVAGPSGTHYFGSALGGVGDTNGDGYDEVLVYGQTGATAHFSMYSGTAAGLDTSTSQSIVGDATVPSGPTSFTHADLEGDGYSDVVVGSELDADVGAVYFYAGGSGGLESSPSTTLWGTVTNGYFGSSVVDAGDVNGDGLVDLLVGASGEHRGAGTVYLFDGAEDVDGDGVPSTTDCDDADASVGAPTDWYTDADGDGAGDPATATSSCTALPGSVDVGTDCDDTDPAVGAADTIRYPDVDGDGLGDASGAALACDLSGWVLDATDCDDADATTGPPSSLYVDADLDGYGDPATVVTACPGTGYSALDTDCDDAASAAHPGGSEVCGGVDEDCDGLVDDDDPSVTATTTWYLDADTDGYGGATSVSTCSAPAGYAGVGGDCDESRSDVHPGGAEICDAADTDEDCDGLADDEDASATGQATWYTDADEDGYGAAAVQSCDAPPGSVTLDGDCDDSDDNLSPGEPELCDGSGVDEDCDGLANEADPDVVGMSTFYADADGDGFGDAATATEACFATAGVVTDSADCDDTDAGVNPAAAELCDDLDTDEDCDGLADDADDSATGQSSFYVDADGDGYGSAAATESACDAGGSLVEDATDCDDADASVNPDGTEVAGNGVDEDCRDGDDTTQGSSDSDHETGDGAGDEQGCGCAAAPAPGAAWLGLLVVGLVARRRERCPELRGGAGSRRVAHE